MIKTIAVMLAAAATLATVSPAFASGGCGVNFHRGPHGGCRANGGLVVGVPGVGVVIGHPGRACPWHYHLGPYGHHCIHN